MIEPPHRGTIYEWEILIEAPFAFDFFKLVRALFRLPSRAVATWGAGSSKTRRRYYLEVLGYNLALIGLVLLMIPFLMIAFSYVATLPFLALRVLLAPFEPKVGAIVAGAGLSGILAVPVVLFLLMFRPMAYRDVYKRSKVETYNILIALSLFLAGGLLEFLIATPALGLRDAFEEAPPGAIEAEFDPGVDLAAETAGAEPLAVPPRGYEGPTESTLQWTLFFADKSMNVLFANLPAKIFGPLSEIRPRPGASQIPLSMLRITLLFGFMVFVRLSALKLCISKKELFYGTIAELRSYLDFCGKAEARSIRRVIDLKPSEVFVVRNRFPGQEARSPSDPEQLGDEAPAAPSPSLGGGAESGAEFEPGRIENPGGSAVEVGERLDDHIPERAEVVEDLPAFPAGLDEPTVPQQ